MDQSTNTTLRLDIQSEPNQIDIKLPIPIELYRLKIENVRSSYDAKNRLPPFIVELYNHHGAKVRSRDYDDVRDTYTWTTIYQVVQTIRIRQVEIATMEIADISIIGKKADSTCISYASKQPKSLYKSCRMGIEDTLTDTQLAKKFQPILDKKNKQVLRKKKRAVKVWDKMKGEWNEHKKNIEEAKELGVKPPIPPYEPDEVKAIKQLVDFKPKTMSTQEKSECMRLLSSAEKYRNQTEIIAPMARDNEALSQRVRQYGKTHTKIMQTYKKKCDPTYLISQIEQNEMPDNIRRILQGQEQQQEQDGEEQSFQIR